MEELVLWIIGIVLVVMLIGGAIQSFSFWGVAVAMNLAAGLILASVRAGMIRRPGRLAEVVQVRWDAGSSTLHWSVEPSSLVKSSLALPMAFLAVIPGAWYLLAQSPAFFAARADSDAGTFFMKAGGLLMAVAGTCGAGALTYRMTKALCGRSVRAIISEFEIGAEQFGKLEDAEREIRALAEEIGVQWPPGLSEDINRYVQREKENLLVNGKAFRCQVAVAMEQARDDARMLRLANQRQEQTLSLFKEVSRAANRAAAITLIKEMEALHEAMTSESMMSLLIARKWKDYEDIHRDMHDDLQRILRQAGEYQPDEGEAGGSAPGETPLQQAFRVLGVNGSMSREAIKKHYRRLAQDYHPDKAEQATKAIQDLTTERFKEIQQAWEIIEKEMPIA